MPMSHGQASTSSVWKYATTLGFSKTVDNFSSVTMPSEVLSIALKICSSFRTYCAFLLSRSLFPAHGRAMQPRVQDEIFGIVLRGIQGIFQKDGRDDAYHREDDDGHVDQEEDPRVRQFVYMSL